MISLLTSIYHAIVDGSAFIVNGLIDTFNAFIVGIAALAATFLALLPSFPSAPAAPSSGILGWLTWIIPLGALVSGFAALVTCWISFLALKVVLKWVKAL